MIRRRFFQWMTIATAAGMAPLGAMANGGSKSSGTGAKKFATYRVKGFSCITCAAGLDTMLQQQHGIVSSKSTYLEGVVTVGFDPQQITEQSIVKFIADLGFTVQRGK
jgi:copper chaperone CopZ